MDSHAALQSYVPDSTTLHLWHLNEVAVPSVDSAPGGTNLTSLAGNATLGGASFAGFGTALNTAAQSNAVLTANGVGNPVVLSYAGPDGAFTYEALVQIGFNPASNFVARAQPFQIMNCDANGTGTRVFQFRMDPVGFQAFTGDTSSNAVRLEFIRGAGSQIILMPVPTNGVDAIATSNWYHVAVSYSGVPNTTSNLLFYWTRLETGRGQATPIGGATLTASLTGSNASTIFTLGNSARNPGGSTSSPLRANFLGRIDEVRISSVARGPYDFIFTNDTDGDSLPDDWEMLYLSTLAYGAGDDPDGDTFTNLEELTAGSNPAVKASTPDDLDADSLPDAWELHYFSTTDFGAADDPDDDDFTNLQEYQAGTNPADGNSNPGDLDADGLPDAWELTCFGNLSQKAGDDFDGDGYSNGIEYRNGSPPNDAGRIPAGPRVRLVPVEDGDPGTSEYGYAGSSAINTVAFIKSALMTVGSQQFVAYYGRHATNASYTYNNTIWVGRRTVGAGTWEIFRTTFTANDITDGHDVVCFGIDGDGFMHMSWGMHGGAFHYARSTSSVVGSGPISFGADSTMTGSEDTATYPQFLKLSNGDLLYIYRKGTSGAGDDYINRYSLATRTWTNIHKSGSTVMPFIQGNGWSPDYNAYPNMPCLDDEDNLYFIWTWRDTYLYQSNHDFAYARSTNAGVTWLRRDGSQYTLPITELGESGNPNTLADEILTIPQNSSIINQAGMCLDRSNNPVVATWWAPGTPTNNFRRQYMVFFPATNGTWQTRQISSRTNDPVGTRQLDAYVRDLGRPVVVCDKDDRLIVLYRDNAGSNGLTVAFTPPRAIDPDRQHWTTMDLSTDNLGNHEPVIDLERWQRDNQLHILYQPSTGLGYAPPANTASQIGVFEWDAAGYFNHHPTLDAALTGQGADAVLSFPSQAGWEYRVQTSTNLAGAWEYLGTVVGNGQWQHLSHTNAGTAQRFWRLEVKEGGYTP